MVDVLVSVGTDVSRRLMEAETEGDKKEVKQTVLISTTTQDVVLDRGLVTQRAALTRSRCLPD